MDTAHDTAPSPFGKIRGIVADDSPMTDGVLKLLFKIKKAATKAYKFRQNLSIVVPQRTTVTVPAVTLQR